MRLPTKRDYASTSMRAARRDPVLQDTNFVKSQAAQQRFYGLDPSAYMALGNAQSRAATAQGNVGLAMGTAALKVDAAVQKVDNILQSTAASSAASEYRDWAATYTADLSNTDLTEFDGKKHKYDSVSEQRKKDSEKFLAELRKKYKFSDASIVADYNSKVSGVDTAHTNRINELIRNAEINVGQASLQETAAKGFSHEGQLEEFLKEASPFYNENQLAEMRVEGLASIENQSLENIISNYKLSNNDLAQIEAKLVQDQLENKTRLSDAAVKQKVAEIERFERVNIANTKVNLDQARTEEELNALFKEAVNFGNFKGADQPNADSHLLEFQELYQTNLDRILVGEDAKSTRFPDGSLKGSRMAHEIRLSNAQALKESGKLSAKGEAALRANMIKDSTEFHTGLLRVAIKNGTPAQDVVRDIYTHLQPEEMYLLPGTWSDDKYELISKLTRIAAGLDAKAEAEALLIQKRTSQEQFAFDVVNGVNTNATTKDKKEVVDHMWTVFQDNSIQAQRQGAGYGGTTNTPEKKDQIDEIADFLVEHNALPSFWVTRMSEAISAGLNSSALNEGNDNSKKILDDATAFLGLLEEYGRMGNGTFMAVAEDYGFSKEHVKLAAEVGSRWSHLSPAEQVERTRDYLLTQQGLKKPTLVAAWQSINKEENRDALFNKEWEKIREVNPDLPELTDQLKAIIIVRWKDLYFSGNESTSGEYAAKLAMSEIMGETYNVDGQLNYAMNGKHPLISNIYGSSNRIGDDNNPVWVTVKDIAAKFEIEDAAGLKFRRNAEDTGYMVFGPDGKQLVNMTDDEGNPLPLDKHRVVTLFDDELSQSGADLRKGIDLDAKIDALKRTLESTTQGDQNKVINWSLSVNQSTDAWKQREELYKQIGSGPMSIEEQRALYQDIQDLGELIEAQSEPQLEALEDAKNRVKSDDYKTRRLAEEEVKLRQNSTFIVASPEMKQKMLDKITADLWKLLEAETEKEVELDYIEDDVERSKANIKAMRDKVKSEQGR